LLHTRHGDALGRMVSLFTILLDKNRHIDYICINITVDPSESYNNLQRLKTTTTKNTVVIIILSFFFLLDCDAPRRNPLDPKNPEHEFGTLSGKVQTLHVPNLPVSGVLVSYPQAQLAAITNDKGTFEWHTLDRQNGYLYFKKQGFFPDSLLLDWHDKKDLSVQSYLNALPVVSNLQVFTVVYNRYPSLKKFQVSVRARVTDSDNDIDSVLVVNSRFNRNDLPAFNAMTQTLQMDYTLADLGLQSINGVIGCPFEIKVIDRFQHQIIAASASVMRVIYDEVAFVTPANYQTVTSRPTLEWQALQPGFPFTYSVEVYSNEIVPQLAWGRAGLTSDVISCTLDHALDPGEYFWIVSCVDEFNNQSRSKPASFKVE
jgi:hypothetical protein